MSAAEALRQQARAVLVRWQSLVRAGARPEEPSEADPLLADAAPAFVQAVAARLEGAPAGDPATLVLPEGAPLERVVREIGLLRQAMLEQLQEPPTVHELQVLLQAFDEAVATAVDRATRDGDERRELRAQVQTCREALAHESRAKDEFLAMLAHELRNPLSAIRSSAELIRLRGAQDDATQRPRQIIERQVMHLTHQVDDLLDVARLSRGTLKLRKQRTDLGSLARHAVETIQPHTARRRQRVQVTVPRTPVWVDADPTRISQCIGNLLHNASKFTEPGREITLSVAAEEGQAVVRVRDPGAGIEPELLPHVFDLYARGVRWVNGTQSGLGLGLRLVRSLVEMHGGQAEARSAGPGQGAEFAIRLPLRVRQKPRAPAPTPAPAPEHAHGLRVMVVDDNVDAASSLAEVLAIWGHQVVEVHDGSSALREAEARPPDVVILDLSMPDMDGHEVMRRLSGHPQRARMRVVALSGYGQAQDRARTAQEGFDDHLVKPVDFAGLERYLAERTGPGRGAGLV